MSQPSKEKVLLFQRGFVNMAFSCRHGMIQSIKQTFERCIIQLIHLMAVTYDDPDAEVFSITKLDSKCNSHDCRQAR